MGALFIINAPWIFQPLWAMIKPWLDPVTKAKFHVLGSNFLPKLLEYIDEDQIPSSLGGKCKCAEHCIYPLKPELLDDAKKIDK